MRKNRFVIFGAGILAFSIALTACNKKSNTKSEELNTILTPEVSIKDEQGDKEKKDIDAIDNKEKEDAKTEDNKDKEKTDGTKYHSKKEAKTDGNNSNTTIKNATKNNTEKPKKEINKSTNTSPKTNTSVDRKIKITEQQSKLSVPTQASKPETKQPPNDSINYGPAKVLPIKYNMRYNAAFEDEIIRLTNELRKQYGVAPLKYDSSLRQSARYKSSAMLQLDYFSHSNPNYNGEGVGYLMLDVFNINSMMVGENIGSNYSSDASLITARARFNGWLNSPSHKEAMINKEFTRIGVGIVITKRSDGGTKLFGTQHFAK